MTLPYEFFRQPRNRYLVAVLLPSLLVLLYLGLIASEGFVSRAHLVVEQESSPVYDSAELALGLLSVGGGKSKQDALLVRNYMRSRTMLRQLDQELDLLGHYASSEVDWLRRLDPEVSQEDFLEFYRDRLNVEIDEESLIVKVEFVAYDPDFAYAVTQALVQHSEVFVNQISRNLASEQLEFIETQVNSAHQRLKAASRTMIELQKRNEVFSPEKESEAVAEIVVGLEVELAKQRTRLKALQGYLNSEAPDIVAVRQQIAALEDQLRQERGRLVGSVGEGLNELMLDYQDAEVGVRLAAEVYKTALASLETTRLETVRKVKYLVSVDLPSLPDAAERPRVAYWVITVFVLLNLLYFVANLIVATIQDHRE